jgi:hypothetical protein
MADEATQTEGPVVGANNADTGNEQTDTSKTVPVEAFEKVQAELEKTKGQYEESGREAKRIKERLEQIERAQSSLNNQPQAFPSEDQVVTHLSEKLGFTQDQARHQYQVERFYFEKTAALETAMKALGNQMKFSGDQFSKVVADSNPAAKEATEFCAAFPELDALPIAEKIERYTSYKARQVPKGRDLSAIKSAAGGATGSGVGGAAGASGPAGMDAIARDAGFASAKHMEEVRTATTQSEYDAIAAKYKGRK